MLNVYTLCLIVLIGSSLGQGQTISLKQCLEYRSLAQSLVCSKDRILIPQSPKLGEFPHHALLGWRNETNPTDIEFRCGGSLISDRFVLTGAVCSKFGAPDIVRLGEVDLIHNDDHQSDFEVESFIRHPEHKFSRSYNDIALIKLKDSVPFSSEILPACLWDGTDLNVTSAIATGFGHSFGQRYSETLKQVELDFLEKEECESHFNGQRSFKLGIMDSQLCVGSKREDRDACITDAGDPVQMALEPNGCLHRIIGIASYGAFCGVGLSPMIITRVPSYINWIEQIVWN